MTDRPLFQTMKSALQTSLLFPLAPPTTAERASTNIHGEHLPRPQARALAQPRCRATSMIALRVS